MFRNRSTAASIRNIFLWKLISSLSLSFQYSSLYYRSFVSFSIVAPLYYVNISQREKLSFKEKKRLESSYESEDRKTFSTSISHHGTKAIYTFLYISSIISISIWLIHNRDDIEIHCFFPLGSPNFLSFFLSISTGDRIVKRAVVYFSLREGIACFGRERNGATCEFRANKEGLFSRDFTEATPRNALLCRGSLRIQVASSLSLSLSRPAPSRATLDTSLVPNLAPVLHGSRKASPPPSLPHSLRSRPGFRGELFGAREKIPRTAHDDESVTENDTCPVAVPRFSSTDRSNHFFFSLSLSRSR